MNIAVAGTGYVGLSIATLLAQHNHVTAVDIIPEKVEMINRRVSPIQDEYIEKFFSERNLDLTATLDAAKAYSNADFVVIAAPTNYDRARDFFDTSAVEEVIRTVKRHNPNAIMVIKSTIPVGFTAAIRKKLQTGNILFSPEFLRESKALYDNLYPSRIIVGRPDGDERLDKAARTFAGLLQQGAEKKDIPTLIMGLTEAEAVKLFANTYLALRVSYFNELDTYAEMKGLDSAAIIEGIGLVRLRRLLPAQGHQAAACQLPGRAPEHDERHCREQPHTQGLHCRPGTSPCRLVWLFREQSICLFLISLPFGRGPGRGRGSCNRSISPCNEEQQRQLPPKLHSRCNEAHQGQGGRGHHLRTRP